MANAKLKALGVIAREEEGLGGAFISSRRGWELELFSPSPSRTGAGPDRSETGVLVLGHASTGDPSCGTDREQGLPGDGRSNFIQGRSGGWVVEVTVEGRLPWAESIQFPAKLRLALLSPHWHGGAALGPSSGCEVGGNKLASPAGSPWASGGHWPVPVRDLRKPAGMVSAEA